MGALVHAQQEAKRLQEEVNKKKLAEEEQYRKLREQERNLQLDINRILNEFVGVAGIRQHDEFNLCQDTMFVAKMWLQWDAWYDQPADGESIRHEGFQIHYHVYDKNGAVQADASANVAYIEEKFGKAMAKHLLND